MKRKKNPERRLDLRIVVAIITAAAIVLAAIIPAVINANNTRMQIELPIQITQTAEARLTASAIPASPTFTVFPTSQTPEVNDNSIACEPIDNVNDIFLDAFAENSDISENLGSKKLSQPACLQGAYQAFDNGFMLWRADTVEIYVFFNKGTFWKIYRDTWVSGMPETVCNATSPDGREEPTRGFGKVWCDNQDVRDNLGFPTSDITGNAMHLQSFEEGWIILQNNVVYALIINPGDAQQGNWRIVKHLNTQYQQISLKSVSDLLAPQPNLGLNPNELGVFARIPAVPFEIGWKASTTCSNFQTPRTTISLNTNVPNAKKVHLLIQAGWGLLQYKGFEFGNVQLRFQDNSVFDTKLNLGFNIRDWSRKQEAVRTTSSPAVQLAWEGTALETISGIPQEVAGGMDVLSI